MLTISLPKNLKPGLLFLIGLMLLYLSLSPGAILGMGYTGENVNASNQILAILGDWMTLKPTPRRVTWPRHGLFELLFKIPFLLPARLFLVSKIPDCRKMYLSSLRFTSFIQLKSPRHWAGMQILVAFDGVGGS
jgi:hypothetical protein